MGCKEDAQSRLGAAVEEFFEAHNEVTQAYEAFSEAKWSAFEALTDVAVCLAQVEDDPKSMGPLDKAGMLACVIDGLLNARKAKEAQDKAIIQRDAAVAAMDAAAKAMEQAGEFYCECIRNQGQSSIDPNEIQQMIDEAHAAIAELDDEGDELESDLDELDGLLSELEDAVASLEDGDSDAALVA